jgi:hypothetical protein
VENTYIVERNSEMILLLAHHYPEICGLDMQLRRGRRVSVFLEQLS